MFSPEGHQAHRAVVTAPSLSDFEEHLDNSQAQAGILGIFCAGPGVGDPDGSLPTQCIL